LEHSIISSDTSQQYHQSNPGSTHEPVSHGVQVECSVEYVGLAV
jgi:spore germination protein YaaH